MVTHLIEAWYGFIVVQENCAGENKVVNGHVFSQRCMVNKCHEQTSPMVDN